jgi:hypothetical protein
VIGKVTRGSDPRGLLRYLLGPSLNREGANTHVDPRVIASWAGEGPVATGEVALLARQLDGYAKDAGVAGRRVWHCSVRAAPEDPTLTDVQWADVAREVMDTTGLGPKDGGPGVRWVAVRHADDHIHLAAVTVREDGTMARTSNDYYRVGEACRTVEERYGLRVAPAPDRTAVRQASRGETEKAARVGRERPVRAELRTKVRAAAAGAGDAELFLNRLADEGLLVRPRYSETSPGEVTGYAVALPGDRNGAGDPVFYGGSKLAADLSWARVTARFDEPGAVTPPTAEGRWARAVHALEGATAELRDGTAPGDVADGAAELAVAVARAGHGRHHGPLTDVAGLLDRARREPGGRTAPAGPAGSQLRQAARLVARSGRSTGAEGAQVAVVLLRLAALAAELAAARDRQARGAQAGAARRAQRLLEQEMTRRQPARASYTERQTRPRGHGGQPPRPPRR